MGYIGKQPTKVPLTSEDIVDESIESADIKEGTIVNSDINAAAGIVTSKVTGAVTSITSHGLATSATTDTTNADNIGSGTLPDARLPATLPAKSGVNLTALNASEITSGTIPEARITTLDSTKLTGTIAVGRLSNAPATDLTPVHQGIATLGLHIGVADNKAAFNLPNAFIDTFEDDTGIATETDTDRDSSGEYVVTSSEITVSGAYTADANTLLLLHMEDTAFTDSSTATNKGDPTINGSVTRSSTQAKFGTYSALVGSSTSNADSLEFADHAHWDAGSISYTIDYWLYLIALPPSAQTYPVSRFSGSGDWGNYVDANGAMRHGIWGVSEIYTSNSVVPIGSWHHWAIVKNGGSDTKIYKDGVQVATGSGNFSDCSSALWIGGQNTSLTSTSSLNGYIDEVRISNIARWTTGFTPNADSTTTGTNATGTLVSTVQTAPTATTEVSGVILYTNASGTNVLGTDLKIYLTANLQGTTPNWTGTNWTEAASYGTAQTFSGTTKQVKLGKTTVTSGTAIAMKAVWANQVAIIASAYETGDRSSTITVTSAGLTIAGGSLNSGLVDGSITTSASTALNWTTHTPASGAYLQFALSTAKIFTDAKWYQDTLDTHGTWQWQGSNTAGGASGYSNIGSTFTLGGGGTMPAWAISQLDELNGNTTAYLYYRLAWQSGAVSYNSWLGEIEFKVGLDVAGKVAQLNGWAVNY